MYVQAYYTITYIHVCTGLQYHYIYTCMYRPAIPLLIYMYTAENGCMPAVAENVMAKPALSHSIICNKPKRIRPPFDLFSCSLLFTF